jgi:acyl carrier protein
VHQEIHDLLVEAKGTIEPLTGQEQLHQLGVTSLMLARLIIGLETALEVDPFAEDMTLSDVRSVDDLVLAYERAVSKRA